MRTTWAIRQFYEEIVELDERLNSWNCWSVDNYEEFLRGQNNIGKVATTETDEIKGILCYTLPAEEEEEGTIEIARLTAASTEAYDCLLTYLFKKLSGRRVAIQFAVSEFDNAMHQRLRFSGFTAVGMVRGQEHCEDSYLFEYRERVAELA